MKFEIITGVNKGYFHGNEEKNAVERVIAIWHRVSEDVYDNTGCYVPAIISSCKAVYPVQFGCPEDGEDVVKICGSLNTKFTNKEDWVKAVNLFAKILKIELEQTTLTLEFTKSKLIYLEVN